MQIGSTLVLVGECKDLPFVVGGLTEEVGRLVARGPPQARLIDVAFKPKTAGDVEAQFSPFGFGRLGRACEQDLNDELARTLALIFLTAAMTGLRQGELIALRWEDVDWAAGRVRVRRSDVRGEFSAPKSRRGVRSVPLADRLAAELEQPRM